MSKASITGFRNVQLGVLYLRLIRIDQFQCSFVLKSSERLVWISNLIKIRPWGMKSKLCLRSVWTWWKWFLRLKKGRVLQIRLYKMLLRWSKVFWHKCCKVILTRFYSRSLLTILIRKSWFKCKCRCLCEWPVRSGLNRSWFTYTFIHEQY